MTNYERFIYAYTSELNKNKHIMRKGQIAFNTLASMFPEIAHNIANTKYDPFYDDKNLNEFFNKIYELLNN